MGTKTPTLKTNDNSGEKRKSGPVPGHIKKKIEILIPRPPREKVRRKNPKTGLDMNNNPTGKGGFKKGNPYAFQPGNPGNPNSLGRPKGRPSVLLSDAYRVQLSDPCPLPGFEGMTWAEVIARGIATNAATGDVQCAKEMREVTEGKTPETVNLNATVNADTAMEAREKLAGKLLIKSNKN